MGPWGDVEKDGGGYHFIKTLASSTFLTLGRLFTFFKAQVPQFKNEDKKKWIKGKTFIDYSVNGV